MGNPILLPGQQLAVAARRLPDPRYAENTKCVVQAPLPETRDQRVAEGMLHEHLAESIEFQLTELALRGHAPRPAWRFDGVLFVDHWVDPDDESKLRLFIELASKAKAVEIHERQGTLVRVTAYFH